MKHYRLTHLVHHLHCTKQNQSKTALFHRESETNSFQKFSYRKYNTKQGFYNLLATIQRMVSHFFKPIELLQIKLVKNTFTTSGSNQYNCSPRPHFFPELNFVQ